ncbi:MAG: diguanylate cyclase [Thiomonas sp.]|uniref:diguanylate cyclase n=1 Tax=Thiomonas sp. TaxID=2047785 RepID=UPI002A35F872|nr:diguanylate cyclase [Thiomonas sp.]MDY0329935.1 diguanylate cyclase [Thiomonas sp.]
MSHFSSRQDDFKQSAYRRIYPLRVVGMALGALAIAGVLIDQHAAPWRWALMVVSCLLWPHIALLRSRLSADSYRAEKHNLLIDSAIAGLWVPLMHFNLLPSVVLVTVTTFDKLSSGMRRLWLASLPGLFGAGVLTALIVRPPVQLESSLLVVICTLPLLVVHTLSSSIGSYRLIRTVSRQNKLLEQLRRTDTQTGLYARDHWQQQADAALQRFHATGQPACLMMIDVDHFKQVNDTFGHTAGDEAISAMGQLIRSCIRTEDCAGRYGGDEFAVLCRNISPHEALGIAERIRAEVQMLRLPHHPDVQLSSSIGLAAAAPEFNTLQAWMKAADASLYSAKHQGRNQVADHLSPSPMGDCRA